ncbi:MAG: amino acid adenylation domain-containing protein, partial [Acidobacteria bacterium]|nr:amino acid adenylation domain-containing protein [Acidobacteriota bacterium]
KENALKAYENQDYQFEYLVKKIVTNRDTGRNPIFDVFFVKNEQNVLSKELTQNVLPKKALTFKLKNRTAKFDITLHVAENNEILRCQFAYCSKLFKKETIERFAAYFKNILSLIVNAPDISLSNIEIITEIEKHQLLYYFNNTDVEFPCYQTIQQLFEENVEKVSDRVAIISMGYEHITYRELNEKTNRLACILLNRGAEPDTIISIIMKRSIKMIIGILGILKAGGAYMPIEPGYPRERIDYMLKDSGVKLLLTESEIGNHKDVTVPLDQNKYQHFGEASVLNFNNLNLNSSKQPSPLGSSNSWVFPAGINPSNIAYVIYTSGSTGRPKGVLVRHEGVTNAIYWRKNEYCLGTNDNVLQLFSYAFDGFVTSFFTPIISGSRVVLQDDEKSKDIFSIKETILSMQITHFICVPSLYRSLLELCSTGELSNLRTITLAGDAVIPALLEKSRQLHPKLKVMIEYGATENTIVASIHKNALPDKGITIGKPIANTKIYILDRAGYLVPIGVSGEIYIAGIGVARGYLNQPELTATKFKKNVIRHSSLAICSINNLTNEQCPMNNSNSKKFSHEYLYHTGDLGRWLPDGNIEFKGRIDLQVKVRGFRIELTEIENELLKHTAVKDAVVSLKETISGEKYLCAYIVLDKSVGDGKSANIFNIEELKEYLAQRLPAYMLPSFIMPLEKIHLNANGKIDRNVLPIPDRSDAPSGKSQETPRDMIDRKLVKIWANVLNMDEKNIGIDDNFFHLGGHSLNATILVSKIHKEFNVKLSLVEIFKKNTISKLSETIKNQGKNKYASLMPVEKMEYYPLTPGQKRYYVIHLMNKHSTGFNIYRVIEIKGILHREKIENIFQELVHRHESLRTSFMLLNHEPVQRIHDHLQLNIEYYDISMEKVYYF